MPEETRIIKIEIDAEPTQKAAISLQSLADANRKLREERKNLDITTAEGRKQIELINQSLDRNNDLIKQNSSTLEKNRLNVGNYTESIKAAAPALDKMTGGAYSAAQGAAQMTKSAMAFIATPIGAVIGAIGVALGALISYFKGSEEGQDRWNKIVKIGSTLLEKLMDVAEGLGEALFNAFSNPKQALIDFGNFLVAQVMNRFTGMLELIPKLGTAIGLLFEGKFAEAGKVAGDAVGKVVLGVENAVDLVDDLVDEITKTVNVAIEQGTKLAALQSTLDKQERDLIVERARVALEVAKLREQSIKQEGDAKRATIQEAINLETQLSDAEVAHAEVKRQLAELELQANGDDKDAKKAVADAVAGVMNAEKQRYDSTLKFQKEIEKLDEEEAKRKEELAANELLRDNALKAEKKRIQDEQLKRFQAYMDAKMASLDAAAKKEQSVDKLTNDQKLSLAKTSYTGLAEIVGQFAGKNKATQISMALADAGLAITRIFSSPAAPFIEPFATVTRIAQAAIVAVKTKKAISDIRNAAAGGGSFLTTGPTMLLVGDNPGGVERIDVTPVSGKGKTRINPFGNLIQLAGGGTVFPNGGITTSNATQATNDQMAILRAIQMMPPAEVSWVEGQTLGRKIMFKESISRL